MLVNMEHHLPTSPVCQQRALGARRDSGGKADEGPLPGRWEQQAENEQVHAHLPFLLATQKGKGNMGLGSSELENVTEGRDGRGAQCVFQAEGTSPNLLGSLVKKKNFSLSAGKVPIKTREPAKFLIVL